VLDGKEVETMVLHGTVDVEKQKAVVVSAFSVASRGRVVRVVVDSPRFQLTGDFVECIRPSGAAT
jgi:hypothetical protein